MSDQTDTQRAEAASWERRTQDELQTLVRAGFSAGEQYDLAVREIERRARAQTRQTEQAAEEHVQSRVDTVNRLALITASISLAAAIAAMLWVLRII